MVSGAACEVNELGHLFYVSCSIFPLLQVQEMGCAHWEDLQQNPEREVCLGNWHGWKGLWVLNTLNVVPFLPMPLIVKMVGSWCQTIPLCGSCRAMKEKAKTLWELWPQFHNCSVYMDWLWILNSNSWTKPPQGISHKKKKKITESQ